MLSSITYRGVNGSTHQSLGPTFRHTDTADGGTLTVSNKQVSPAPSQGDAGRLSKGCLVRIRVVLVGLISRARETKSGPSRVVPV